MSGSLDVLATFRMLREVLARLRLKHVFIGALPVLAWGRIRTTTDLDLVIVADPAALTALDAELIGRGATRGKATGPSDPSDPIPDIAAYWHAAQPVDPQVRIDVFLGKTAFEQTVLDEPRVAHVLGEQVPVARPEASIIYKLLASRSRDLDDVESIFVNRAAAREPLDWDYLDRWAEAWEITDRLAPHRKRFKPS